MMMTTTTTTTTTSSFHRSSWEEVLNGLPFGLPSRYVGIPGGYLVVCGCGDTHQKWRLLGVGVLNVNFCIPKYYILKWIVLWIENMTIKVVMFGFVELGKLVLFVFVALPIACRLTIIGPPPTVRSLLSCCLMYLIYIYIPCMDVVVKAFFGTQTFLSKLCVFFRVYGSHTIHGTGTFSYMDGWFLWDQC